MRVQLVLLLFVAFSGTLVFCSELISNNSSTTHLLDEHSGAGEQPKNEFVLRGQRGTAVRRAQSVTPQCWADAVAANEKAGLCTALPGSVSEPFLEFMTKDVMPAMETLGSVLNPKVSGSVGVGDSCLCNFGIEVKAEKLIKNILKSKFNPCYKGGERGSGKFSVKKAESTENTLLDLEGILEGLSRIPVVKVYARKLKVAANKFVGKYVKVSKKVRNSCTDLNTRAINGMEKAVKTMEQLQDAHEIATSAMKTSIDLACLVQGSPQTTRHRRALWRIHKMRAQHRRISTNYSASATQDHGRFLAFNPEDIDTSGLEKVIDKVQSMSSTLCETSSQFDVNIGLVETTFEGLEAALDPLVQFGDVINTVVAPIVDVFKTIVDALSFLQCPDWLGFICDLDTLIVGIVEEILKAVGLDVDALIGQIVDMLAGNLPLPEDFDTFFALPVSFDILQPLRVDLDAFIEGLKTNPFTGSFDTSGETDITVPGDVDIEFRLASGTETAGITCGGNLLPVTLGASMSTSCDPNIQFTSQLIFPCGFCFGDCSECTVKPVEDGLAPPCAADRNAFAFLDATLSHTNIVYTCLTQEQFKAIEMLPILYQTPFSIGDTYVPNNKVTLDCDSERGSDTTVEFAGYEYFQRFLRYIWTFTDLSGATTTLEAREVLPCQELNPNNFLQKFVEQCDGESACTTSLPERCLGTGYGTEYFLRALYWCLPPPTEEVDGLEVFVSYAVCSRGVNKELVSSQTKSMTVVLDPPGNENLHTSFTGFMGEYEAEVEFEDVKGNLAMECPAGRVVHVLQAARGSRGGIAGIDPDYKDVTDDVSSGCRGFSGQTYQNCRFSIANDCPDSGYRVFQAEYECLCEGGFEVLPDSISGECVPCGLGKHRWKGEDCELCDVGYFNNVSAAVFCKRCACGSHSSIRGSSSCTECSAGTYDPDTRRDCENYSPDTFAPERAMQSEAGLTSESSIGCRDCPLHHYSSSSGADQCEPCSAGQKTIETGSAECIPVDPGEFNDGINGPQPCAAGSFSAFAGETACELCPVGTFAYFEGGAGCSNCTSTYTGACSLCPLSTYSDEDGRSECIACGNGTYTLALGATSRDDCILPGSDVDPIDYTGSAYENFTFEELLLLDMPSGGATGAARDVLVQRRLNQRGNGICNGGPWNTKQGGWDGGDCCAQSCSVAEINNVAEQFTSNYTCRQDSFVSCRDPAYAHLPKVVCSDDDLEDRVMGAQQERSLSGREGNGICDSDLNVPPSYDGGDCCPDTCKPNPAFPFQSCVLFSCIVDSDSDRYSGQPFATGLECPAAVTKSTDAGKCFASIPDTTFPLQGRVCGVESYDWVDPPPNLALGNTTLMYEARADGGSVVSSACDITFTVLDMEPPTITCPADATLCDTKVPEKLPVVSDNCDANLVAVMETKVGGVLVLGRNVLTYTVSDNVGNSGSCAWNVTVEQDYSLNCGGTGFPSCGLFGFSFFCPFTKCGFTGRLIGLCKVT